jgi:uncharacterized 2Fe-2S/4Fe-4S cluster protein (DUF4445 family)
MIHGPLAIGIDFGTNAEMALKPGSRILVARLQQVRPSRTAYQPGDAGRSGAISDLEHVSRFEMDDISYISLQLNHRRSAGRGHKPRP